MHFFVAKLLSIAVMTYSYIYHLQNLHLANFLRTQRINFSMRPQHVRMMRDPVPKTRILGLSVGEDFVILACVVLTQCQRVTDRWTDGKPYRS